MIRNCVFVATFALVMLATSPISRSDFQEVPRPPLEAWDPQQSPTLSVGSGDMAPGETITIPLAANLENETLGAATIEIRFDPAVLDATACTADPDNVFDLALCNQDAALDTVAITAISAAGATGAPLLAAITFRAVSGAGDSSGLTLTITAFADPSGEPIGVNVKNGQINILFGLYLPVVSRDRPR